LIDYLGFITEGKLAAIFIKPSLGVSNWPVIFTSSTNANKFSGTIIPAPSNTNALATANARISSLEAELEASRKAFHAATAAKVNAEKSTKSALAKAKKAEKALTDANKEHLQREQAVAERLNTMFAAAGGTYYTFLSFC
jgi:hypothetical protein